jgi:ABC-2 type transport system permease protein
MKGILAIYRRELNGFFVSPIAYIVVGVFLVLVGFFFYNTLGRAAEYALQVQIQAMQTGRAPEVDIPGLVIRSFMGIANTVLLFMVPLLTMGVYAEERKRGTMELLMTSPVTEWQIVAGKYLASLTVAALMIVLTLPFHLLLAKYSEPGFPWRVLWSGYLGLLLFSAALAGIGTFISSLTENQIIAGVSSFAVSLLLLVIDFAAGNATTLTGEILQYLSILRHYEDFARGVIDTTSIVLYLSLTALGLFLTLQSLTSMRWRRA